MVDFLKHAIIVDLASLDAMSSQRGAQVHHGHLLERLTQDRRLVRAVAYGTFDDDHPDAETRFAQIASDGYKVVSKPLRRRADGVRRASLNVNIAVDALELAPHIEMLSLVTADADFVPLIEAMQRSGVRVELITTRELVAPGLVEAADVLLDFSGLFEEVRRVVNRPRDQIRERGSARTRIDRSAPRNAGRRQYRGRQGSEDDETADAGEDSALKHSEETSVDRAPTGNPQEIEPRQEGSGSKHTLTETTVESQQKGSADNQSPDTRAPVIALPEENISGRAVAARRDTE